jgi:hypothetical protein
LGANKALNIKLTQAERLATTNPALAEEMTEQVYNDLLNKRLDRIEQERRIAEEAEKAEAGYYKRGKANRGAFSKELGDRPEIQRELDHADDLRPYDPHGADQVEKDAIDKLKKMRAEDKEARFVKKGEVDPYRREKPLERVPPELAKARKELARDVQERMPKGTKVSTPSTERTAAGDAQGAAASRSGESVAPDVEFEIDLPDEVRDKAELPRRSAESPKTGTFKPDDIRFSGPKHGEFTFVDHKEVESIWKDSYYAADKGQGKIRDLLERNLKIVKALRPKCLGWVFTTNQAELAAFIKDEIGIIAKSDPSAIELLKAEMR